MHVGVGHIENSFFKDYLGRSAIRSSSILNPRNYMERGYRKKLGDWGEQIASNYLETQGYEILARNFHTHHGELDLIATKNKSLCFIEVKTRSNHAYGFGEEAINAKKLQAMFASIESYLESLGSEAPTEWQIDIIIVEGRKGDPAPTILHYENIGEETL